MTLLAYALGLTIGIAIGALLSRMRYEPEIERLRRDNEDLMSCIGSAAAERRAGSGYRQTMSGEEAA